MHRRACGGYAGLIALIMVAAIIVLIFWGSDLLASSGGATSTSPRLFRGLAPLPPESAIEQNLNVIEQAKGAKQQLESRY